MAPKKNSRSALYYYAQECMDNKTCRVTNIREAIEAVYPAWKAMSMTDRMPYETRYENWKKSLKEDIQPVNTKAMFSSSYDDTTMDESQLIGLKIDSLLKKINDSKGVDALKSIPFYLIKFQTFCKCDKYTDDKLGYNYSPYNVLAEVALVKYNLEKGILNTYHAFIKPNKIPLGYRSQCMDTARDLLGEMPLDGFSEVTKTYAEIYDDIYSFVKPNQNDNDDENNNVENSRMIFCLAKDMNDTKFGMKFLFDRYSDENLPELNFIERIYDLENLVNKLAKFKKNEFLSANEIFSSYSFDYALRTRCNWHEEKGIINCSLGIVKKYAFLISDNICQLFDVRLTTNHLPEQESVSTVVKSTDSGFSRQNRFNTRSNFGSNSNLNENNSSRSNISRQDEMRQSNTYNYPVKRTSNSPVFNSTDIRYNYETTSTIRSTVTTEASILSDIPSVYKSTRDNQSKANLTEIPQSLNEEDGWITRSSNKSGRNSNQDVKSVISDNSNTNDNGSSLSSATKTLSSYKYQGRGRLVKRN